MTEDKHAKRQPSHIAYCVIDGKDNRSHWHRIGAAWPTKDDGLMVTFDSVPLSGKLALRPSEELKRIREKRKKNSQEQNQETTLSQ